MYSPKVQKIWNKYCRIACLGNLKTFASHSDTYTFAIGPKRMNFFLYIYLEFETWYFFGKNQTLSLLKKRWEPIL